MGATRKEFPLERFFPEYLQERRYHRTRERQRNDRQHHNADAIPEDVCGERGHRERERQRHASCFGHIKASGRNIEPKERERGAREGGGERAREGSGRAKARYLRTT